jgi:RNA-directed DNA polymerase
MLPAYSRTSAFEEKEAPPVLLIDGRPLVDAQDVARFFGATHSAMTRTLYKAPEHSRYRSFEIPKRSGGLRRIDAPIGLLRELQERLAPILQDAYDAHPGAHGFIKSRGVLTNAKGHAGQRLVLNIDLEDFFPSINFGRVRGLFMARPFLAGPSAASVLAQICTHRNGLPQGAPTSPALSNFIAAALDRRMTRLAKDHKLRYSRYADDITFSSNLPGFPPAVAVLEQSAEKMRVHPGEALERAVESAGFSINLRKVRLQAHSVRQSVTGIIVNQRVNVERKRIRRVRAMLHAWAKFGLDAAGKDHFEKHRGAKPGGKGPKLPGAAFRNVLYGQLAYIKMVRGADDPVFLKLCGRVLEVDPNPSRFVRQMVFGADDFEVFISHASEDKETVARPIYEACTRIGLKVFLDEPHIAWGENFARKINTALGAARTVVAIISSNSVSKEWPVAEVCSALEFERRGAKRVVPVVVGHPDLSSLPMLAGKSHIRWAGNAEQIARRLYAEARPEPAPAPEPPPPEFRAEAAVQPPPRPALTPVLAPLTPPEPGPPPSRRVLAPPTPPEPAPAPVPTPAFAPLTPPEPTPPPLPFPRPAFAFAPLMPPEPPPPPQPVLTPSLSSLTPPEPAPPPLPPLFAPYTMRPIEDPPKRNFLHWLFGEKPEY